MENLGASDWLMLALVIVAVWVAAVFTRWARADRAFKMLETRFFQAYTRAKFIEMNAKPSLSSREKANLVCEDMDCPVSDYEIASAAIHDVTRFGCNSATSARDPPAARLPNH